MLERSHSVNYKQDNIEYVDVTCVPGINEPYRGSR